MSTSRAKARAHDASVAAEERPTGRPATDDERSYLAAMVDERRAAVSKIEDMIDATQVSLRTAKAELATAEGALDAAQNGGVE